LGDKPKGPVYRKTFGENEQGGGRSNDNQSKRASRTWEAMPV